MRGYLKELKTEKFVLQLGVYQDVVDDLASLSLDLQTDDLPITSVRESVQVATLSLRAKITHPGPLVCRVQRDLVQEGDGTGRVTYKEFELKSSKGTAKMVQDNTRGTIEKVLECIEKRFESFSGDEVFLAFEIFDPANLPIAQDALASHGNKEFELLLAHFQPVLQEQGCNTCDCPREWLKLKLDIARNHSGEYMVHHRHRAYTHYTHHKNGGGGVNKILKHPDRAYVFHQENMFCKFKSSTRLSLNVGYL